MVLVTGMPSAEAVQHGDPDMELCDLPVEVARHEALTEELDAVHLRLRAAAAMMAAPWGQTARPRRRDARRASLRAAAPAVVSFQGCALRRGGMTAAAPRAAMAS
jgi:hypothetical protein